MTIESLRIGQREKYYLNHFELEVNTISARQY